MFAMQDLTVQVSIFSIAFISQAFNIFIEKKVQNNLSSINQVHHGYGFTFILYIIINKGMITYVLTTHMIIIC